MTLTVDWTFMMKISVEMVTPDAAATMLERNTLNRPIRSSHVANLAEMIRAGQWKTTHQGVAIAPDGRLLDGQHRLWAIIMANEPVMMVVARNVDPATFSTIDAGRPRSVSDATGQDPLIVAVAAALIVSAARTSLRVSVDLFNQCMSSYGEEIRAVCILSRRKYMSAPLRAGFALRMASNPTKKEWYLDQLRLFAAAKQSMAPQVYALYRNISEGKIGQKDILWRVYASLDTNKSALPKIVPAYQDVISAEIARVHSALAPGLRASLAQATQNMTADRKKMQAIKIGHQIIGECNSITDRARPQGFGQARNLIPH